MASKGQRTQCPHHGALSVLRHFRKVRQLGFRKIILRMLHISRGSWNGNWRAYGAIRAGTKRARCEQ